MMSVLLLLLLCVLTTWALPDVLWPTQFNNNPPTRRAYTTEFRMGRPARPVRLEIRFDVDDFIVLFRDQQSESPTFRYETLTGLPVNTRHTLLNGSDVIQINLQDIRVPVVSDPREEYDFGNIAPQCGSDCNGVLGLGPNSYAWTLWPDMSLSSHQLFGNRIHPLFRRGFGNPNNPLAAVQCTSDHSALCTIERVRTRLIEANKALESSITLESALDERPLLVHNHELIGPRLSFTELYNTVAGEEEERPLRLLTGDQGGTVFFPPYRVRFRLDDHFIAVPPAIHRRIFALHNIYDDQDLSQWEALEIRMPAMSDIDQRTRDRLSELGFNMLSRAAPGDQVEIVLRLHPRDYIIRISARDAPLALIRENVYSNDTIEVGTAILERFVMHKHAFSDLLIMYHHRETLKLSSVEQILALILIWVAARWTLVDIDNHRLTVTGAFYELFAIPMALLSCILPETAIQMQEFTHIYPFFLFVILLAALCHTILILRHAVEVVVRIGLPYEQERWHRLKDRPTASFAAYILRVLCYKVTILTSLWMIMVGRQHDGVATFFTALIHLYLFYEVVRILHTGWFYVFLLMSNGGVTTWEKWVYDWVVGDYETYEQHEAQQKRLKRVMVDSRLPKILESMHMVESFGVPLEEAVFESPEEEDNKPRKRAKKQKMKQKKLGKWASPYDTGVPVDLGVLLLTVLIPTLLLGVHFYFSHAYFIEPVVRRLSYNYERLLPLLMINLYLLVVFRAVLYNRLFFAQSMRRTL